MKEAVETILKPLKIVDSEVNRWYTKKSQGVSNKRLSKITGGLGVFGLGSMTVYFDNIFTNKFGEGPDMKVMGAMVGCALNGLNNPFNGLLLIGADELKNKEEGETLAEDSYEYYNNKVNSFLRLPLIATGLAITGKNIYSLVDSALNGTPLNISDYEIGFGLGCLSSASSMYLKDRNPKLLEKNPAWKRAYNSAKEKIKSLIPQPFPQPIPVEAHYKLEERV
ncbi:MAG: hypothetical protein AABW50_03295 [Nanoarchaeota archaeon]